MGMMPKSLLFAYPFIKTIVLIVCLWNHSSVLFFLTYVLYILCIFYLFYCHALCKVSLGSIPWTEGSAISNVQHYHYYHLLWPFMLIVGFVHHYQQKCFNLSADIGRQTPLSGRVAGGWRHVDSG